MNTSGQVMIPITKNDDEKSKTEPDPQKKNKRKRYSCFQWIELIAAICIPVIIGLYTIIESTSNVSIAAANRQKDINIAEQSRQKDHDISNDQQLETILIGYQDFLAKLILDNGKTLNKSPEAKIAGQFKTLTALEQLDARRNNILIRSLYNAQLITLRLDAKSSDERAVLDLLQLNLKDLTLGAPRNSPRSYPANRFVDWSYLWLPESILTNVSFRHTRLDCATFSHTHMYSVDLNFSASSRMSKCFDIFRNSSTNFVHANLINTTMYNAYLQRADFAAAQLTLVDMRLFSCKECTFWHTKLFQVDLTSSRFDRFLYNAWRLDFQEINLEQVVGHSASFSSLDFSKSIWSNVQASAIKIIDCTFINAKVHNSSFVKGTFEKSIFQNANLYGINLSNATLHYISFVNSTIRYADLSFIKCYYCSFTNITFENVIWANASLRYSNFRHCHVNLDQLVKDAIDLSGSTLSNGTDELTLGTEAQHLKKIKYYIRIKTGEDFLAGTDADIYLKIFGKNIDTDQIEILSTDHQSDMFERGQTDRFTYEFVDLGNITYILIEHGGNNYEDGWFLDWIEIDIPIRDEFYRFNCECWFDGNENYPKTARALQPKPIIKKSNVLTGTDQGAGTDANVHIIIFDEHNNTGKILLTTSTTYKDPFENGQIDVFQIEAMDIIKPTKIKIGHDNSDLGSDWLLKRVDIYIAKLDQTWTFPCEKWSSDFKNEFELEVKYTSNI